MVCIWLGWARGEVQRDTHDYFSKGLHEQREVQAMSVQWSVLKCDGETSTFHLVIFFFLITHLRHSEDYRKFSVILFSSESVAL